MSISDVVSSSIQRYGQDVTIYSGDDAVATRAFIEPLRYRTRLYIGGDYRQLGTANRNKYLYVGNPNYPLEEYHSIIESGGIKYRPIRCEEYIVDNKCVYIWAILKTVY